MLYLKGKSFLYDKIKIRGLDLNLIYFASLMLSAGSDTEQEIRSGACAGVP